MPKRAKKPAEPKERKNQFDPDELEATAETDPVSDDPEKAELLQRLADLEAERDKYKTAVDSTNETKRKLLAAQAKVTKARAAFDEADAARKKAKAAVDKAIADELLLVARWTAGEQHLPFPEEAAGDQPSPQPNAATGGDAAATDPISVLGQKNMKVIAGKEEFARLKEIGEPIGLTEKELETLESAGFGTIGELESKMRENEWWHRDISGFGETKVNKLINSLRVFRKRFPQPVAEEVPAPEPEPEAPQVETVPIQTPEEVAEQAKAETTSAA